jgi:phage minor structural protein
MFLKVFYGDDIKVYRDIDSTFFRTRSEDGLMSLQFDISPDHELYRYFALYGTVEYDGQRYLINGINERKTVSTITCELDLTGLNFNVYQSYNKSKVSFSSVCSEILKDTGWTIVDADLVSARRTLELTDVTTLDILDYCQNSTAYNTRYRFDTINKVIYCIKPYNTTEPTGTYFTDELNLSDMTYKGSTASLVTRLYPYGKDNLSISSLNNGKNYIENHSYTDKVISAIWRDERYTNKQRLLDDGVAKLAVLAVPEQSYTAKIIDFAKALPDTYGDVLAFDLYDIVTLIDRKRKTRINHRIVEIKEYPADATLNTVTLSTVPAKVTGKLQTLQNKVTALDAQILHNHNKVNEIKQDLDTTVLHVSDSWASSLNKSVITQTAGGLYFEVEKVVGSDRWSTLLQQSANDVKIAWNNISSFIKFESAQLNVYNSSNTKLMSLSSFGQDIFDSNGQKLMSLNSAGQKFYYKGVEVGYIGTGCYENDESKRDLSFNLENGSAMMDWCYRKQAADTAYTLVFTYAAKSVGSLAANQLHAGCDLNLHGYNLRNAVLSDWSFDGGTISDTISGYYAKSYHDDGRAATWRQFKMVFKNGILTDLLL